MVGLITAVLLGGAAIGLLSLFWKEICNFLNRAMEKVRQIVRGIVMGARIFLKKMWEGVQEISKNYSYDQTSKQWEETIVRRTVSESEVPADILAKVGSNETDVTRELEMQLSA